MSKSEVPTEREWLEGIHPNDPRMPTESNLDQALEQILTEHRKVQKIKHAAVEGTNKIEEDFSGVIKAIKQAIDEHVIGKDTNINEIKVARMKNIKGNRKGADVVAFDWTIEIEGWKNNLRAEQREALYNPEEDSNQSIAKEVIQGLDPALRELSDK